MSSLTFNRIKEVLAKKSVTNKTLAAKLKVKEQTVSSWCTNSNQPSIETLFEIAEHLEEEAGNLLTLKKDLMPTKKELQTKTAAKTKSKKPSK